MSKNRIKGNIHMKKLKTMVNNAVRIIIEMMSTSRKVERKVIVPKITPKERRILAVREKKRKNIRYTKARVDSLNLSSDMLISHFNYSDKYALEVVKTGRRCNEARWRDEFGKSLYRKLKTGKYVSPFTEAYIVHTEEGAALPLKVHARSKGIPTLEFAGMQRYDPKSSLLKATLQYMKPILENAKVTRIDVCIDVEKRIQHSVKKALSKNRIAKRYKNTTYYQLKRSQYFDICIYPKNKKDVMQSNNKVFRIEFSFRTQYLKNAQLKDISALLRKIEKTISRATNLNVKVENPLS